MLVVDVGSIEGRGWAVVEANPAWGSGVCSCDVAGVLRTLEAACPAEVVPEHRRGCARSSGHRRGWSAAIDRDETAALVLGEV